MRGGVLAPLASLVTLALVDTAEGSAARAQKPAPAALAPLPMLPSVGRVRAVVGKTEALVIEEVTLPRGGWKDGALDLYVAFGAPGIPRAIDAQLVAVPDGVLEAREEDHGENVATTRAPRRPASAHPLLGRDTMAGVVVHLPSRMLAQAFGPGGMAVLRVRSLVPLPEAPGEDRSVLVRLGASRGTPLTLGRITVSGAAPGSRVAAASARLCGPDADPSPLAVAVDGAPPGPRPRDVVAPVLAVRHTTDDLCLTFRTDARR